MGRRCCWLGVGLSLLVGCGGTEEVATATRALVAPHVYAAPALPTANYPPPASNVVFVALAGDDATGTGAELAPYRTLGKALQVVNAKPAGPTWTVVLKAGTYREGELTITRDNVTVQRYRTDLVSLRGSVALTAFTGSGPYSTVIGSPDPTRLEQDCSEPGLIGAAGRDEGSQYALAITRNGVPLRRVALPALPGAGQYTYDHATHTLRLADSPSNVEVTYKLFAIMSKASGVKLAGLDIQGYATCVVNWKQTVGGLDYYKAAVMLYKDWPSDSGAVLESSTVANNAAGGVNVANARNVRLSGNSIVNHGWTGAFATNANGLVVQGNDLSYNNVRRIDNAVQAGMKITYVEDGAIVDNRFEHNAGNGFWCDQHCGATDPATRWFVIARNLVRHNDERGLFYEVSHHGVIASNVVHDNGSAGIAAFGSRNVQVWNNTAVDNNARAEPWLANIAVVDDNRCYTGDTVPGGAACTVANGCDPLTAGNYDHCEPSSVGPLANTCNAEGVVAVNNIVSGSAGPRPLFTVQDPNPTRYGAYRIMTRNECQAFWRPSVGAPGTLIDWQLAPGSASVAYPSLTAYRSANPTREAGSVERTGGASHPFFVNYPARDLRQSTASADVWDHGCVIPPEVLRAVFWPSTAPAQPLPRIGAIVWRDKPVCPLAVPVLHVRNPLSGVHLYTLSASEVSEAVRQGFTEDLGVAFHAAASAQEGTAPVFRVFNPDAPDHLWTLSQSEKESAAARYGYTVEQGIGFHVAVAPGPCLVPVYRLVHGALRKHVYTASATEKEALVAAGWTDEQVRFYAAPP